MPNYVKNTITLTGSQNDISNIYEMLKNKNTENEEEIDFNNVIPMPKSMNVVSGGYDKWYVAAYIKTLPENARMNIAQELLKYSDGFYKSYYHKYVDSFTKEIPNEIFTTMLKNFKQDYESINPESIEEIGKTYIDNILNYGADTWYDWSCNNWGSKWGAMSSYITDNIIGFETAWSPALPITEKLSEMYPNVIFSHEWADEDIGHNCGRYKIMNGITVEKYFPQGEEAVLYACDIWGFDSKEYDVAHDDYEGGDIDEIIQEATVESVKNDASKTELSSSIER